MNSRNIILVTYSPSPYQVEFFNEISKTCNLFVAYIQSKSKNRLWGLEKIQHNYLFLDDNVEHYQKLESQLNSAELVIFNYYQNPDVMQLIQKRFLLKKPWCFWGERMGYHQLGFIGSLYRKWKFPALHQSKAPIFAIGEWAVKQYQHEFGPERQYFNLSYFSNLERFAVAKPLQKISKKERVFLFSGSFITRKGVDLLAEAFSALADEFSFVHLHLLGEGPLRSKVAKKLAKYGDRVQFLGFQNWQELPKFYQEADILCVPSRYDGWALVVPEGLAAGLPVISTTKTGAALELIETKKNGWLVPAGKKNALYAAMKEATLLSNVELFEYSKKARESVADHSLEKGAEKFNSAVQAILNQWS